MEITETRKKGEEMKTNREKVKQTKNLRLRRNTMKATRLTLIGLAVAAVIAAGCSRDNRIAGPDMEGYPDIVKNQSDLTYLAESESNAARIAVRDDGSAQEHLAIVAEVFRTEVEGGCWYLNTENGDNYTPLTPKSLTLKLGMVLKAEGYVDKSIIFFCGLGPAFVIEQYEILDQSEISFMDRAHVSGANVSSASNQEATSVQKFDKKISRSDEDAASKPTNDGAADKPTEDRAPQAADYQKKKLIESENSGLPMEDRAPAKSTNDGAADRPTEDRAPQATEYEKKKMIESEDSGLPTEDRAPQKYEPVQKDAEMKMHFAKPVPIIINEAATSGTQGINTLEGYTHYAKGGCLMITASNKEVFEIQHDTDAVLKEGYYIRVTGYISTLAVVSCEDAPVFYAQTLKILWRPEKSDLQANDQYVPADEASNLEYIEVKGVMHRTAPEGACWYFESDKGDRFELLFSNQVSLRSGTRLKVKGVLVNVSTFCGSGKPLQVAGWEVLNENKF
jgi:hypothetical protein